MFSLKLPVLCAFLSICQAEWFSSLGQMEDLVYDELDLLKSLNEYIKAEENKLNRVRSLAENFKKVTEHASSNMDRYLGHPVNQYRLVQRLVSEWSHMENLVMEDVTDVFLTNLSIKRAHFPNADDVKGSAEAIMRLQDTYKLDTHDLAEGIVKGSKASQTLTAVDCFDIGRTAYLEKDFYHCVLWMNEALLKDDLKSLSKFDVLDHLAYCVAQQGNIQRAYEITSEMLELDPYHERIQSNHAYYRNQMGAHKKGDNGDDRSSQFSSALQKPNFGNLPERELYERLCRKDTSKYNKKVEKKLKCKYWTNNNHPLLILQPAKLEELWPSPHLVRFHDVLSDQEIAQIKAMAKPRLNRATVQNPQTGVLEHARYRVSKSAWIKDWEDTTVATVSQRISAITGLSMVTAEELQIANYGVGGQYEPHYDYSRKSDVGKFEDDIGNRIATFLFYLSDVEHGAAQCFYTRKSGFDRSKAARCFGTISIPLVKEIHVQGTPHVLCSPE
uniref:Prolyl 4-hydroxylase subunit alpha-1-like n=1 Tax=Phallusia mammillata TaxID=59560 RepID=A0A6F9DNP9_9ASCI|nr:prolyl 4-hydroxylase subunit alpha-1-like [Phallusia mammillata]